MTVSGKLAAAVPAFLCAVFYCAAAFAAFVGRNKPSGTQSKDQAGREVPCGPVVGCVALQCVQNECHRHDGQKRDQALIGAHYLRLASHLGLPFGSPGIILPRAGSGQAWNFRGQEGVRSCG